jgi:hypothetical protein
VTLFLLYSNAIVPCMTNISHYCICPQAYLIVSIADDDSDVLSVYMSLGE